MKTIEKKIQKIDELYARLKQIRDEERNLSASEKLSDMYRWSQLFEEGNRIEGTIKRSVKSLMKDFGCELNSSTTPSERIYLYLFDELKNRYRRAKSILAGEDRFACYTKPIYNEEIA
jgi:hypothetical protein